MGAIIKVSNAGSVGATAGLQGYLQQESKTCEILMYGQDCDVNNFAQEFQDTKNLYDKVDGRQHTHIIQSWRAGEVTHEQAHEIGKEFLKHSKFEGFQAVVITHLDKNNTHNHIVINSVNLETGLKYHQTRQELQLLKEFSNEINLKRGIEPEKKIEDNKMKLRVWDDKGKYKVLKAAMDGKESSYVKNTYNSVVQAVNKSMNREQFIQEMKNQGYETTWTEKRKNVTFEITQGDFEGKKVRLSNLQKTFGVDVLSKEGLTQLFENKVKAKEIKEQQKQEPVKEQSFKEYIFENKILTKDNLIKAMKEFDIKDFEKEIGFSGFKYLYENNKALAFKNLGEHKEELKALETVSEKREFIQEKIQDLKLDISDKWKENIKEHYITANQELFKEPIRATEPLLEPQAKEITQEPLKEKIEPHTEPKKAIEQPIKVQTIETKIIEREPLNRKLESLEGKLKSCNDIVMKVSEAQREYSSLKNQKVELSRDISKLEIKKKDLENTNVLSKMFSNKKIKNEILTLQGKIEKLEINLLEKEKNILEKEKIIDLKEPNILDRKAVVQQMEEVKQELKELTALEKGINVLVFENNQGEKYYLEQKTIDNKVIVRGSESSDFKSKIMVYPGMNQATEQVVKRGFDLVEKRSVFNGKTEILPVDKSQERRTIIEFYKPEKNITYYLEEVEKNGIVKVYGSIDKTKPDEEKQVYKSLEIGSKKRIIEHNFEIVKRERFENMELIPGETKVYSQEDKEKIRESLEKTKDKEKELELGRGR